MTRHAGETAVVKPWENDRGKGASGEREREIHERASDGIWGAERERERETERKGGGRERERRVDTNP